MYFFQIPKVLAFGLIASMANVLTKGSVLTDNLFMQRVWAWTQCIAIDASVAGIIIRTFRYYAQGERVKYLLNGFLSGLLLFTAAIVSNIESVQQTLNIALEEAYVHVLVPVEALIWIRSLAIVLLIVAHALRHVQPESEQPAPNAVPALQPAPLVLTPELVDALRAALAQVTVAEEPPMQQALPSAQNEQRTNTTQETSAGYNHEQSEISLWMIRCESRLMQGDFGITILYGCCRRATCMGRSSHADRWFALLRVLVLPKWVKTR
jgi:hypothetical protein